MEPISLEYSTKNIPVPSNNTYFQMMIRRVEKFIHNARWKANFFLHPEKKPQKKQYFGFKSNTPSPQINELKEFENELVSLSSTQKIFNIMWNGKLLIEELLFHQ